jgi:aryl-alcohol dehydrogenase-like predicted oxidoreductase
MELRPCGQSGLELSVVGLGCWSFGGGDYWGEQDAATDGAAVRAALDAGINYFDTAEIYNDGRSEESLGQALKGRRHQAILGTKIPPQFTQPAVLRQHLDASLRRLQTDYVDLYFVHWPITECCVEAAFLTLGDLQQEGKIRSIAVSNFGPRQLYEALATGTHLDANQLCYSLFSRAIEAEIVPLCQEHGIGILGYMPLLQGILADKWRSAADVPPLRARTRHFSSRRPQTRHGEPGAEAEMFAALGGIRQTAAELGVPMSRLAIAWCISKAWMTSVLVGARTPEQVRENAAAAALRLPPDLVARLDALTQPVLDRLGPNADYWQSGENSRVR